MPAQVPDHGIDQLPVLPAVLTRILRLDPDDVTTFDRLVALAEVDPPFAARLLHLANSARYLRRGGVVLTVQGAVHRMGFAAASELITALSVARVFVPRTDGQRRLWQHSVQVAIGTRMLGRRLESELEPGLLYQAGLLHDLGRFLLFETNPDDLGEIDEYGYETPAGLVKAERAICGTDHATLGAEAAARWGLPAWIVSTIAHHHGPPDDLPEDLDEAVSLVRLADTLSVALGAPGAGDYTPRRGERIAVQAVEHTDLPVRPGMLVPVVRTMWVGSRSVLGPLGL